MRPLVLPITNFSPLQRTPIRGSETDFARLL